MKRERIVPLIVGSPGYGKNDETVIADLLPATRPISDTNTLSLNWR